MSALDRFSSSTRTWFESAFARPTPAQDEAWNAIADGDDALVVAPTGSGKTLAAFLWAIDALVRGGMPEAGEEHVTRILYISPLKALGTDVARNLELPLAGIGRLDPAALEVRVGVRSGDSTPSERRRLVAHPPDILVTTPESLYLMLTSQARSTLAEVGTVIVDEVHAVAGTKRGAHLALTLERLDALLERPAQRIGLSATVEPPEDVARFLGGAHPARLVSPPSERTWELSCRVPVDDMTAPGLVRGGPAGTTTTTALAAAPPAPDDPIAQRSIWPHVLEEIFSEVMEHRTTLVFVQSRWHSERVAAGLNELAEAAGMPDPVAAAHHGSLARERRTRVERSLVAGDLRCVVATGSLELGIDVGHVDQVIQVAVPMTVSSAVQRIGRSGHSVGETSRGVFHPLHRSQLIPTAVTIARVRAGALEPIATPRNPLDVLAQQTVAAVAMDDLPVDEWFATVTRAAPFSALPRSAFDAVLDMLAGRYATTEMAAFSPRLVWDRTAGVLRARPGAQRLAVTSGGTIPDRGLFPVLIAAGAEAGPARRVGDLDEEMVYESRVGDVIALGATSWRIDQIESDRVLVTPAPGRNGSVPFWHGDGEGRAAVLGQAIGHLTGELAELAGTRVMPEGFREAVSGLGLDEASARNLYGYLHEQREATGYVPTDTTLVLERFHDELGDWRLVLHSPYGRRVHSAWAIAVAQRVEDRYGMDGEVLAADDAIVIRLPDTGTAPPGADIFLLDSSEAENLVRAGVGGSGLFAARFRECASRALLLPRRDPGRRSPLWQQRQRSGQLLGAASKQPDFPIILETVRECLQDVYDMPALSRLLDAVAERRVNVVEVEVDHPSPFARTALFGYIAAFLYDADMPLAERKAAALSLDQSLLTELMGEVSLRDLLDPSVIERTELEVQMLAPDRHRDGVEGTADLLRILGPLTPDDVADRLRDPADAPRAITALIEQGRAFRLPDGRLAASDDATRLRDGLGLPTPPLPAPLLAPVPDPLGDLVGRWARTHGPFTLQDAAVGLRAPVAVVAQTLDRLAAEGAIVRGAFRPRGDAEEFIAPAVLRTIRSRSLAALRRSVEPVPQQAYAAFLPAWQHVGQGNRLRGEEGLLDAIDQLSGLAAPASEWETTILPARVDDFTPAMLDAVLMSGQALWSSRGRLGEHDAWIAFHLAESASLTLPTAAELEARVSRLGDSLERDLMEALNGPGAFRAEDLRRARTGSSAREAPLPLSALGPRLWSLAFSGLVTNDSFAPVRGLLGSHSAAPRMRRPARARRAGRRGSTRIRDLSALGIPEPRDTDPRTSEPIGGNGQGASSSASGSASFETGSALDIAVLAGRWSALRPEPLDATVRAAAGAELLLDRHGILTRGSLALEDAPGGFSAQYPVLNALEQRGEARRGYFIEKLGAAQFAAAPTVDRIRREADRISALAAGGRTTPEPPLLLAATDPANAYGAALPWPAPVPIGPDEPTRRPARRAGAHVILDHGRLLAHLERAGTDLLLFTGEPADFELIAGVLAESAREGGTAPITIDSVCGVPLTAGDYTVQTLRSALTRAGFYVTPRGVRARP